MRNVLLGKVLWGIVLPIAFVGATFAGANCDHARGEAAGKGAHCNLDKKVVKDAKMTDDGAVVTLKGKNAAAVAHIKEHLAAHAGGEPCPGCPLSMEGVTTKVEMTDNGGTITATGSSPETIKAIQEWASQPAGSCCKHGEHADKV